MWNAAFWGAVSGSAVLLGALAAMFLPIRKKLIGYIMAFGTGVLIGAASFELLGESVHNGGLLPTGIGFMAGAVTFTLFDIIISKKGHSTGKGLALKQQPAAELCFSREPLWMLYQNRL